jgi:hypothetical protein
MGQSYKAHLAHQKKDSNQPTHRQGRAMDQNQPPTPPHPTPQSKVIKQAGKLRQ